jgi:hypothetical protein
MLAPLVVPFGISFGGSLGLGALIASGRGAPDIAGAAPAVPQQVLLVAQPPQLSVAQSSQHPPRRNHPRSRANSPPPQPQSSPQLLQPQSAWDGAGAADAHVLQVSQQSSLRWNRPRKRLKKPPPQHESSQHELPELEPQPVLQHPDDAAGAV